MSAGNMVTGCVVALAALSLFGAAVAQDSGYDLEVAPGYDTPDKQVVVAERELVQPFNSSPVTSRDQWDSPINEFAGQRIRTDPGIFGEALGNMKRGIVNSFDSGE